MGFSFLNACVLNRFPKLEMVFLCLTDTIDTRREAIDRREAFDTLNQVIDAPIEVIEPSL